MAYNSGKIGNIKVTNNDQILHWWKLNSNYDEGLNDEDFYTFWHSVCELFAMIYQQTAGIVDVYNNIDLIKRFLDTFGVKFNQSTTDADVHLLYSNWVNEIKNRGTFRVAKEKDLVRGRCLNLFSTATDRFYAYFLDQINIGNIYSITVDCKFSSGSTSNGFIYNGNLLLISFSESGGDTQVSFYNSIYSLPTALPKSNTHIYEVKLVRNVTDFRVYIDDVLVIDKKGFLTTEDEILGAGAEFFGSVGGGDQKLGNLRILAEGGIDFEFPLNTLSYYFYDKVGQIYGVIDRTYLIEDVIVNDDLFLNNDNYYPIDGELIRLVGKEIGGECLFPLIGKVDLDWNTDTGSPQSSQTYPIVGFNKFQNKGRDIFRLDHLPVYVGSIADLYGAERITIENGFILGRSVIKFNNLSVLRKGIGNGDGVVLTYPTPSIWIPVDETLDYEISFRIHITAANSLLRTEFYIIGYEAEGNPILPKSAKSALELSTYFLNDLTDGQNSFKNFTGESLWVRGILYHSSKIQGEDVTGMNFDFFGGRNLIMGLGTKFIIPSIFFTNEIDPAAIYLWDIQVRPIELNTSKGDIGVKRVILPYLNNKGDYNNEMVSKIIRNSLSPYNTLIKTNFL